MIKMAAITKYAKKEAELAKAEAKAKAYGKDSDEYKTWMTLRYTAMHVCCLYRPESKIREFEEGNSTYDEWYRPMKGARKKGAGKGGWKKLPELLKHSKIDFNIETFYKEIMARKKKNKYMYFYRLIQKIGIKAGISDLSPNSLRHSTLVYWIEVAKIPIKDVADIAGCDVITLQKHYAAIGKQSTKERLRDSGAW